MGGSLLVGRASTLAGYLALFLGGHRRKPTAFLTLSCISALCGIVHGWTLIVMSRPARAGDDIRCAAWFRRRILDGGGFWFVRRGLGCLVRRLLVGLVIVVP